MNYATSAHATTPTADASRLAKFARTARWLSLTTIATLTIVSPTSGAWWWHLPVQGTLESAYGNPSPPPPVSAAVFRQFLRLLADFETHFHGFDPHAFHAWVMLRGITDPHEVATMVELYVWFAQNRAG